MTQSISRATESQSLTRGFARLVLGFSLMMPLHSTEIHRAPLTQ